MPTNTLRFLIVASLAVVAAIPAYAKSAPMTAKQAAMDYGTRLPTTCPVIKADKSGPPPASAIVKLVKCDQEKWIGDGMYLEDNVKVQVASHPIPWNMGLRIYDADVKAPVYQIRGSLTSVVCFRVYPVNRGRNCEIQHQTGDEGSCYHNSFGDWACGFRKQGNASPMLHHQPPTPGTAAH